jgi:hypothetical protein
MSGWPFSIRAVDTASNRPNGGTRFTGSEAKVCLPDLRHSACAVGASAE